MITKTIVVFRCESCFCCLIYSTHCLVSIEYACVMSITEIYHLRCRVCGVELAGSHVQSRICGFGFTGSGLQGLVWSVGSAESDLWSQICGVGFAEWDLGYQISDVIYVCMYLSFDVLFCMFELKSLF